MGATSPPKTQIMGETYTVLEIAGESWLAKEEVVHAQMVDAELDLTLGHPEDPHKVTHARVVSAEPDLTLGHPENPHDVARAQLVSAEPDPLPGDQDNLEDDAHVQTVDVEPVLTWGHPEDPSVDAHAQFVSVEPDPPLGDPHEDARAHPECTELEVLTDTKDDLLHEVKEVEEETTGVTAAADEGKDPCVDLQGLGVSQQDTTLEGTNTLTFPSSQSNHPSILLRTESSPRLPVIETGTQATRKSRPSANTEPPPLDLPPLKGATETLGSSQPEQIQAPTHVERLSELLQGKKSRRATGQDSQVSARVLEGRTPLGMAHGRPPDPADPYMQGSTVLERNTVDPKALVHVHQAQRPVPNEGADVHIDPWPNPGTIHINTDAYFEVSVLLEGEQNFALPSADSKQAVTPKIFSFTSWLLVLPLPNTLGHDLKPSKGAEAERCNVARCPARLKPAGHVAEDPNEAGGAWREIVPPMPGCPQLGLEVDEGNIEAPNPCMVEATRRTKWPPRGQATEDGPRPDWPLRKAPWERDPNILKGPSTCKPEREPVILKSATPGHLEVKSWHSEGEPPWKGLVNPKGPHLESAEPRTRTSLSAEKEDKTRHREGEPPREGLADPQSPHSEATEPRTRTSSSAEKEDESYKNEVSMAGIDYNDAHLPPFPFCIALGHSCSAYPHLF